MPMTTLEYLRDLHDASFNRAKELTFDGLDAHKRAALLLYANISNFQRLTCCSRRLDRGLARTG
jgi:hypothetical protein